MNYPEMHPSFERDLRALSDKMLADVLRADLARPEGATQEHKLQLYISECRRRGFYGPDGAMVDTAQSCLFWLDGKLARANWDLSS